MKIKPPFHFIYQGGRGFIYTLKYRIYELTGMFEMGIIKKVWWDK